MALSQKSDNISYHWEADGQNSQLTITFKNIIGEKEANELLKILSKLKDHDKVIELKIFLSDVELFTPVFISNLFLLASHKNSKQNTELFNISIYLPYEDATTYSFSHITGLMNHSFFANKIKIWREKKNESEKFNESEKYNEIKPHFVISDSFLPSLYLKKETFQSFFLTTYKLKEIDQEVFIKNDIASNRAANSAEERIRQAKYLPNRQLIEYIRENVKIDVNKQKLDKKTDLEQIMRYRELMFGDPSSRKVKQEIIKYFSNNLKSSNKQSKELTEIIEQFTDVDERIIAKSYASIMRADELYKFANQIKKANNKLECLLAFEYEKIEKRSIKSEYITLIDEISKKYNINDCNIRNVSFEDVYAYYSLSLIDKIMTLVNYADKESYLYKQLKNNGILDRIFNRPLYFIILYRLIFINTTSFSSVKDQSRFVMNLNRVQLLKEGRVLQKKEQDLVEKYCEHLEKIYYFVDSVYQGIYELSKNVVEHSSSNHGILNVRLFNYQDIIQLKRDNQWSKYFSVLNDELSSNQHYYKKLIDISITDDGENGIIDTRYSFLKNALKEIEKEERDKEMLKKEAVLNEEFREITRMMDHIADVNDFISSFHYNYFNIEAENHFATMYKKILGGYGLKIFTANIENNYGCYSCRSYSSSAKSLKGQPYGFANFFKNNFSITSSEINVLGTQYNFVFPIVYKKIEEISVGPSADRMSVGEDVLLILDKFSFTDDYTAKEFKDKSFWKKDSNAAAFHYFEHHIKSALTKIKIIPVYDFGCEKNKGMELDKTALLRFMAEKTIENDYTHPFFIIVNIERKAIEGLLELLLIIHKYFDKKSFWSDKEIEAPSCMIFYHSELPSAISYGNNGMIECVLLTGHNISEFLALNQTLSYYQFASIPVNTDSLNSFLLNPKVNINSLIKPPFFYDGQPILFDLLIKIRLLYNLENEKVMKVTIFENNVHRLLTTEIKNNDERI